MKFKTTLLAPIEGGSAGFGHGHIHAYPAIRETVYSGRSTARSSLLQEGDRHRCQSDTRMEFESVGLDLKTQMSGLATACQQVQEGKQSQAHFVCY